MVAERYQNQLKRIKDNVQNAYTYFEPNYKRYHEYRGFVYDTSLSPSDSQVLSMLGKPQIQCNITEAFISRLLGEFAKQEPSITVSAATGGNIDLGTINVVDWHMRSLLFDANNDQFEYDVYKDALTGGFSVMKVWTEYQNEMSFDQCIRIGRPVDVTLCGFDPLAMLPHKGDGRFCFELFPKTKEEFKQEYPDIDVEKLSYTRGMSGFNWCYQNNNDKILLICDYYEKKKRKKKIVKLSNDETMTMDEYEEHLARHQEAIAQGLTVKPPYVIVQERWGEVTSICRYRFIENQVIEYVETDYDHLPLVFVDGNSIVLKNAGNGAIQQMTRPYTYHARDIQRFKNYAFQTWANEIENMVTHKWIVPKEGIPQEYKDAYENNQIPSVIIYNSFKENNTAVPLQPPREVQRPPMPPEIMNAMQMSDSTMQLILGSFDASLGINDNQLSGVAIIEGATQSNAAAMPFIVGFLQGLNQAAQIIAGLIPKYYKTPRTIPIMKPDGKRDYVKINVPGAPKMDYDVGALDVKVEAGVNFQVQKAKALNQLTALMNASPLFAQFMNAEGLEILVDNLEIKGVDQLKLLAAQFVKQMKQQQAKAANMPNPQMLKLKLDNDKLQQQKVEHADDVRLEAEQKVIDHRKVDNETMDIMLDAKNSQDETVEKMARLNAENKRSDSKEMIDLGDHLLRHKDQEHKHVKEATELAHQIKRDNKPEVRSER